MSRVKKPVAGSGSMVDLPWHNEANLLLKIGQPPLLLLVGEPGVGKTTFARHAALATTGSEPLVLSGSPEVEQAHFFGRWTLVGQETRFVDGPLPLALKTARWLVIEEFSQIPVETRASLMPLRDQATITNPLTGEVLTIPPTFRLIATTNSESLGCRKNSGIARVLYDGFMILEAADLTDAQVTSLLKYQFPSAPPKRVERVLELWNKYRELGAEGSTGKSCLSLRAAEHLMRLLDAGMAEGRAAQIALINKFLPADPDLFKAANLESSLSSD